MIRDRRRLGGSDLEVTSVGLDALWWRTVEAGVNFVDTAEVYGHGASETILGDLLGDTDAPMVVATKVYPDKDSAHEVRKAAEGSLRRLGLDVIDLYQVHWWPPRMDIGDMMRELDALARDGLVRYLGVSNFSVEQVEEAASHLEHADIVSNQVHYSLLHRDPETGGLVDHHARNDIAVIAYSPLEQGILTGKFSPDHRPGGFRADKPRFSPEGLEAVRPVLAELDTAARAHGRTMGQAALAWLLKDPNVVVIPGAKNLAQLEENVGGADWQLTRSEVDRIEIAYAEYAQRF